MSDAPKIRERRLPSGLSPSSMDLYHQCPKRFEIQKIDGGYDPSGRDALLGTFVHRALELLMQMPAGERSLDNARACAVEAWPETETNKDFILLDLDDPLVRDFKKDAWWSIRGYFEIEDPDGIEVESTEEFMHQTINGVNFRGIIDRVDHVDGATIICDYKSGKVPDPRYRAPKIEQLNFYAAMIRDAKKVMPERGRLLFTTHAEVIETKFTEKSVEAIIDKATQTWDDIIADFEGRGFNTKVGPLCGWCPSLSTCPDGMAEVTLRYRKGRLKSTAPGYSLVAKPRDA